MSPTTLEVFGTVQPDGTLRLDEKLSVPPGRVKVRLEPVAVSVPPTESLVEFVVRARREMAAAGSHFMTDDEVAAWIKDLREDGDRIERAYRDAEQPHRRGE